MYRRREHIYLGRGALPGNTHGEQEGRGLAEGPERAEAENVQGHRAMSHARNSRALCGAEWEGRGWGRGGRPGAGAGALGHLPASVLASLRWEKESFRRCAGREAARLACGRSPTRRMGELAD